MLPEGAPPPHQLRRLLDAVLVIGADLDLEATLRRIVEAAVDVSGARYGALGVLDESRATLSEFVTVGIDEDERAEIGVLPKGHGILGTLIVDPRPLRLPDLREHPDSYGFPPHHPPMTSFLGVPILIRGQAFGNLYLCDKHDDDVFSDVDEDLVVTLAAAAAAAIDNARLHARVGDIARFEDRERIARDLHDTVIQRVFAVGLSLQGALRLVTDPIVTERIETAIDELDTTVREVRAAIFELQPPKLPGRSAREAVLALSAELARSLGFDPTVRFSGPVDAALDGAVIDQLLAVQREALSNVARHAGATSAEVTVAIADGRLTLTVADDGRGVDPTSGSGRGVANMAARAEQLGGQSAVRTAEQGGTILTWTVPVDGSS